MSNKRKYAFVSFSTSKDKNGYIYDCNDLNCKVGNVVAVPVGEYIINQKAIVVKTKFFTPETVPYSIEKIKPVHSIVSETDENFEFDKSLWYKSKTDYSLLKDWKGKQGNYIKCYYTNYNMTIDRFKYDGVTEICLDTQADLDDYNLYNSYTITSGRKEELEYLKTIMSQYHYGLITLEEFWELFAKF